jgi:hypothetical protein
MAIGGTSVADATVPRGAAVEVRGRLILLRHQANMARRLRETIIIAVV